MFYENESLTLCPLGKMLILGKEKRFAPGINFIVLIYYYYGKQST
jgi:hypothetical protein